MSNTIIFRIALALFSIACHTVYAQSPSPLTAIETKYDTLPSITNTPLSQAEQYNNKLNSIQTRLDAKIDSLTNLPTPDKALIKSLDSLRGKIDSLKSIGLSGNAGNVSGNIISAEQQLSSRLNDIEGKINQKLGMFSLKGGDIPSSINLPGTESLKLLSENINNPLNDLTGNNLSDGTGDLTKTLNEKLPESNLDLNTNQLSDVKNNKISELTDNSVVNNAKGHIGETTKISGEANDYVNEAKDIASGNSEAIETRIGKLEEVQQAQKDLAPVQDYTKMIDKWNSDPDYAREVALAKAKDVAVNHFAGHEEELKAAMNKMNAVKEKYPDTEVVLDLFKKPGNPMKGKSFGQRLLPGIGFQLQLSSHQWYDFNPYVGYRWTGRWTTGIGWTERLASDIRHRRFVRREHAFGPRAYVDFKIKQDFLIKAEAEYVNSIVTSPNLTLAEPNMRTWVLSYFAGLKKSFKFSEKVMGNVQLLYNLYDPMKRSPYMSRINVRIGFEFPYKKQKIS